MDLYLSRSMNKTVEAIYGRSTHVNMLKKKKKKKKVKERKKERRKEKREKERKKEKVSS